MNTQLFGQKKEGLGVAPAQDSSVSRSFKPPNSSSHPFRTAPNSEKEHIKKLLAQFPAPKDHPVNRLVKASVSDGPSTSLSKSIGEESKPIEVQATTPTPTTSNAAASLINLRPRDNTENIVISANSAHRQIQADQYHFDSTHLGSNSYPIFRFPKSLSIKSIQIQKVHLPHSFYSLNSESNTIRFAYFLNIDRNNRTFVDVVVPPGHYSVDTFVDAFQTALNSTFTSDRTSGVFSGDNWTVQFDDKLFRIQIKHNVESYTVVVVGCNPDLAFCLGFPSRFASFNLNNGLNGNIGYELTTDTFAPFYNSPRFSPALVNLHFEGLTQASQVIQNFIEDNTIISIPVCSSAGGYITYTPPVKHLIPCSGKPIGSFALYFTDEIGQRLNFHGLPFQVDFIATITP